MQTNLDSLKQVFEKMENDGLDTSQPLKWGYFFFNKAKDNLIEAFKEIEEREYTLENIFQNEDNDWVMEISKIEVHDPESLNNRNEAMNRLAEHFEIELYDGWDVGKI